MDAALLESKLTEAPDVTKAEEFFSKTQKCKEKKYDSVGKGWDYRFDGKLLVGSALKFGKKVIHMAFFVITESDKAGEMASSRRRTRFRR
jgi:hypothetical protein